MRVRRVIVAAVLALGLLGGQALAVGAYSGNTAGSPDPYRCTAINTTPGNLAGGAAYTTCTASFHFTPFAARVAFLTLANGQSSPPATFGAATCASATGCLVGFLTIAGTIPGHAYTFTYAGTGLPASGFSASGTGIIASGTAITEAFPVFDCPRSLTVTPFPTSFATDTTTGQTVPIASATGSC